MWLLFSIVPIIMRKPNLFIMNDFHTKKNSPDRHFSVGPKKRNDFKPANNPSMNNNNLGFLTQAAHETQPLR